MMNEIQFKPPPPVVSTNGWKNNCDSSKNGIGKHSTEKNNSHFVGQKFGALLVLMVFSIVSVKLLVLTTGRPINMLLTDTSIDMVTKVKMSSIWLTTNYGYVLWPIFCGLAMTIFTWAMVYFDSDVPGVNPPSPLSPRKTRYRTNRERTCHLSYLMSIASGCIVFFLLYFSNNE